MKPVRNLLGKTLPGCIALALVLGTLISSAGLASAAGNNPLRIVLSYYDPIQITYTISYPASSDKDDWTGPQDVPIGGVGVPDPTNEFAISSYLATQVYCVDPFTAFHSLVPGVGGSNGLNPGTGANSDTVSGYVSAAPWAMSGAMQTYGAAVGWVATNGYRGTFNYGGTGDAESQASVARLQAMFPTIGTIDKTIALMATKVAIWKLIGGSGVTVESTSLDSDATRRATFDALVTGLVNAANQAVAGTPTPGQLDTSSFSLQVGPSTASPTYDDTSDPNYNLFGPMTVTGTLDNPGAGGDLSGLTEVALTASGLESSGVQFLASMSSTDLLPAGTVPGTAEPAQMVAGTETAGVWTSDEFYLAIPKGRTPDRGDALTVNAMAMAPDVPVQEGTPIVFAFADPNTQVQDWEAIQAFIGGTSANQSVNLYAEANWQSGTTSVGTLRIAKTVQNASPQDVGMSFNFKVYYNNSTDWSTVKTLNLTDFPVRGAVVDPVNNTFSMSNGGMAIIAGLPMNVSGSPGYSYHYWVEEVSPPTTGFDAPSLALTGGTADTGMTTGNPIGPFQLDTGSTTGLALVTVTNIQETGKLSVVKSLAGDPSGWGVTGSTQFQVKIEDLTYNNDLLFQSTPWTDGSFRCIGNDVDGLSEPYAGTPITELTVTAAQPVEVSNLWAGHVYAVVEVQTGQNFTTTYSTNGLLFRAGGGETITVVNTYGTPPTTPNTPPNTPNITSETGGSLLPGGIGGQWFWGGCFALLGLIGLVATRRKWEHLV